MEDDGIWVPTAPGRDVPHKRDQCLVRLNSTAPQVKIGKKDPTLGSVDSTPKGGILGSQTLCEIANLSLKTRSKRTAGIKTINKVKISGNCSRDSVSAILRNHYRVGSAVWIAPSL